MKAYYNDNDPGSAAWLRELIKAGLIMDGDVDERSITEVKGTDLEGYGRVHFFAGIGGWDYALYLAGWPPDRYVWTGSCPCQPVSGAGKRKGERDERHLWPHFHRLIEKCRPPVVFGEQVASRDGREWFAGVRADLEALDYAVGGADLCAAGEGAPHIRQRLYWLADAGRAGQAGPRRGIPENGDAPRGDDAGDGGATIELADALRTGRPERRPEPEDEPAAGDRGDGGVVYPGYRPGSPEHRDERQAHHSGIGESGTGGRMGHADSRRPQQDDTSFPTRITKTNYWSNSILIPCGDGKARRIEPGLSPLVDGLPGRVGLLRGYGNAIVPEVAAEFIRAFMNTEKYGS